MLHIHIVLRLCAVMRTSYWANSRIHFFGNENAVHALLATPATSLIDRIAYDGRNIRAELRHNFTSVDDTVIDLCCGTGTSTKNGGTGVDMSVAMLAQAKKKHTGCTFVRGNAEDFGSTNVCDVSTVCFALHEMPAYARRNVLRNAIRIARKRAIFCDIADDYHSSALMRMGEPYLLNFQENILEELFALETISSVEKVTIFRPVPHHVFVAIVDLL